MTLDFSFDKRVAQIYDKQRLHPPEVSRKIGEVIASQIGDHKRVLEIGVGTGRIAKPVAMAGCKVVGIDVSAEMLDAVQADEEIRADYTQADMRHLPFCDNAFAGVMAVHVLHLVKDWQEVLSEAARVLKSDGVFIQGDDWIDPKSVVGMMRNELRRFIISKSTDFIPPSAGVSREQVLADLGGTNQEEIIAAEWTTMVSPADRLHVVENRADAESWVLPVELYDETLQHLRDYATQNWSDVEEKQPCTRRFLLKVTRGNW